MAKVIKPGIQNDCWYVDLQCKCPYPLCFAIFQLEKGDAIGRRENWTVSCPECLNWFQLDKYIIECAKNLWDFNEKLLCQSELNYTPTIFVYKLPSND